MASSYAIAGRGSLDAAQRWQREREALRRALLSCCEECPRGGGTAAGVAAEGLPGEAEEVEEEEEGILGHSSPPPEEERRRAQPDAAGEDVGDSKRGGAGAGGTARSLYGRRMRTAHELYAAMCQADVPTAHWGTVARRESAARHRRAMSGAPAGQLDEAALGRALRRLGLGLGRAQLARLFGGMDVDGDGEVSEAELLLFLHGRSPGLASQASLVVERTASNDGIAAHGREQLCSYSQFRRQGGLPPRPAKLAPIPAPSVARDGTWYW